MPKSMRNSMVRRTISNGSMHKRTYSQFDTIARHAIGLCSNVLPHSCMEVISFCNPHGRADITQWSLYEDFAVSSISMKPLRLPSGRVSQDTPRSYFKCGRGLCPTSNLLPCLCTYAINGFDDGVIRLNAFLWLSMQRHGQRSAKHESTILGLMRIFALLFCCSVVETKYMRKII